MTPLRQRMIEDMQVRNLAPHTQRVYVEQISRFARHFGKSPELLGPADIRAYLLYLGQDRELSASSIVVAVSALRFLYKVTLRRVLLQTLTRDTRGDGSGGFRRPSGKGRRQSRSALGCRDRRCCEPALF
jgi:hypothetical protein